MEEVNHSKGSRHKRKDTVSMEVDLGMGTGMREYTVEAHLPERKLTVICVRSEILKCMKALA